MKKEFVALAMSGTMLLSLIAGSVGALAGETEAEAVPDLSGTEMEVATYLSGETLAAYKQVISDFEAASGAKITLDEYGDDYERMMKTRMASN